MNGLTSAPFIDPKKTEGETLVWRNRSIIFHLRDELSSGGAVRVKRPRIRCEGSGFAFRATNERGEAPTQVGNFLKTAGLIPAVMVPKARIEASNQGETVPRERPPATRHEQPFPT
jgi:hypothetical protein